MKLVIPDPNNPNELLTSLGENRVAIDYAVFELEPHEVPDYRKVNAEAVRVFRSAGDSIDIDPEFMESEVIPVDDFMHKGQESYVMKGYQEAFYSSPHSMRNEKTEALMQRVNKELFNNFENVEICSWSTDWSDDYFETGDDSGWGAYWWTVYNKDHDRVVVAAISVED
jgi:hypothetical protein